MLLCVVQGKDILWLSQFKICPSLAERSTTTIEEEAVNVSTNMVFQNFNQGPFFVVSRNWVEEVCWAVIVGWVVFASKRAYLHTLHSTRAICQRECRGTSPVWKEVSKNFELFLVFLGQVELDPEYSCTLLVCRSWSQIIWHNWTSSQRSKLSKS